MYVKNRTTGSDVIAPGSYYLEEDMIGIIVVCLTNGGKSEWLTLPTHPEEAGVALCAIGAEDGGYVISECNAGFDGRLDGMITGADLNVVNYLAARLAGLTQAQIKLLEAMLESSPRSNLLRTIEQVIDFTYNLGTYQICCNVHGPEDLAHYYINQSGLIQIPPEWAKGIDLKRFGKNLEKHEPGYYTRHGYLISTGLAWMPDFKKGNEVPSEYHITNTKLG